MCGLPAVHRVRSLVGVVGALLVAGGCGAVTGECPLDAAELSAPTSLAWELARTKPDHPLETVDSVGDDGDPVVGVPLVSTRRGSGYSQPTPSLSASRRNVSGPLTAYGPSRSPQSRSGPSGTHGL